ncbi:MAG: hypothetical protein K2K80_04040 [Clostridia bacterium]|nr:hypothetical protein [Clostridia bacterium]
MKKKSFFLIVLSLLVCFGLIFSACSKSVNFNFDENSTVKLTYTCADEENDFDTELNAEQSHKFILSLNKIAYVEVKEHIVFGPSYDRLRIIIGNNNLELYDVGFIMKYGGYFHFNGQLYKSEEKFDFLKSYLTEYCPDIIPESVSFGVQYVKSTVDAGENCQIIKSVNELNNYIATQTQNINLPNIVLFKDEVIAKYNDEYFENSFLVIFMRAASSGSYGFMVNNAYITGDRLTINYEIVLPTGDAAVTCDMAYWYSFVELSNEYGAIKNVYLISSK